MKTITILIFCVLPMQIKAQPAQPSGPTVKQQSIIMHEEMPRFPGGEGALQNFIRENMVLLHDSVKKGIVYVNFIVTEDGSIKNAQILRGLKNAYDLEALRIVNSFPDWIPGWQNGRNVSSSLNVQIIFQKDDVVK